MKKILFFVTLLVAATFNAQNKSTLDIGRGYSQNGGFSFSFASKYQNSFGWYLAARGLNLEEDSHSGIDYCCAISQR